MAVRYYFDPENLSVGLSNQVLVGWHLIDQFGDLWWVDDMEGVRIDQLPPDDPDPER